MDDTATFTVTYKGVEYQANPLTETDIGALQMAQETDDDIHLMIGVLLSIMENTLGNSVRRKFVIGISKKTHTYDDLIGLLTATVTAWAEREKSAAAADAGA